MKFNFLLKASTWIFLLVFGVNTTFAQTDAKVTELLDKMIGVTGDYSKLRAKNDVSFNYVYDNFDAGKDVSQERLIFDGEQSWASYSTHQRNVLPKQEGVAEQSLINGVPQLTLNGKFVTDKEALGATVFIREVNPFWFTMIYKLKDNGTIYKHMGTEEVDGTVYDKVSLKYNNAVTGKVADDEYILYFNPNTHLIDLFYFSLPAFGVNAPILKMTLSYDVIEGIYIPTTRESFGPNPETGEYQLGGRYTFKEIKFNNGFTAESFMLKEK